MRTEVRKARTAIGGEGMDAAALVQLVVSKLDRAASKGIIHPRAASRTKSRLARQLHASKTASK
jgi:ribosomal protein S20